MNECTHTRMHAGKCNGAQEAARICADELKLCRHAYQQLEQRVDEEGTGRMLLEEQVRVRMLLHRYVYMSMRAML